MTGEEKIAQQPPAASLPSRKALPPFEALRAFDAVARLGGVRMLDYSEVPLIYYCEYCEKHVNFHPLQMHVLPDEGPPEEYTFAKCDACNRPAVFIREDMGDGLVAQKGVGLFLRCACACR